MAPVGRINRRTPTGWTPVGWYLVGVATTAERDAITDHADGQCVWVGETKGLFFWDSATASWLAPHTLPDGTAAGDIPVWGAGGGWTTAPQALLGMSDVTRGADPDGGTLFYDAAAGEFLIRRPAVGDLADGDGVVLVDGTRPMAAGLDLGQHKVVNMADPSDMGDAVNLHALTEAVVGLQAEIDRLVTGLSHAAAVQGIADAPPTAPAADEFWIVGASPTGAWAGHAHQVAWWDGSSWDFSAPDQGEARLVEDQAGIFSWTGTGWVKTANTTVNAASGELLLVGDIRQSVLTESQFKTALGLGESGKWVLADGRNVAGSRYEAITGSSTVPDLRGGYIRMAGQSNHNIAWNGGPLLTRSDDTTRLPRTPFTLGNPGDHTHALDSAGEHTHDTQIKDGNHVDVRYHLSDANIGLYPTERNWAASGASSRLLGGALQWSAGAHSHGVHASGGHTHAIGGGDAETRPKSVSLNFYIKIN